MKIQELIEALEDFQMSNSTDELTEVLFHDEVDCPLDNAPIHMLHPINGLQVHPVNHIAGQAFRFLVLTNVVPPERTND